jgi:hypothetical protein
MRAIESVDPNPPQYIPSDGPQISTLEGVLIGLASLVIGHFLKPIFLTLGEQFRRDSQAAERFSEYLEKQLEEQTKERELYFQSMLQLQQQAKDDREACAREREEFLDHLEECGEVMQGFAISMTQVAEELRSLSLVITGIPGTTIHRPQLPQLPNGKKAPNRPSGDQPTSDSRGSS